MSPRKGGLGRRPGKKRYCKQKRVSHSSLTASKIILRRNDKNIEEVTTKSSMKNIVPHSNQLVRVCIADLVLCLESKNDERLIEAILKENLRSKTVLMETKVRAKKRLDKVSFKLKEKEEEMIIQKKKGNASVKELKDVLRMKDNLTKCIEQEYKTKVTSIRDDAQKKSKLIKIMHLEAMSNIQSKRKEASSLANRVKLKSNAHIRKMSVKHRVSSKIMSSKYEVIIKKCKAANVLNKEHLKRMEVAHKTERQDRLLARTLKVQMSKKIHFLEHSLIDTNISLDKVRERKCIANARAREATRKSDIARKQSDKRLAKVKELTQQSVSLNDQLMEEQETNKDLKEKLIPLQQIKVKDFCKVKTSFCHMETIGAGRGNEWPLWMLQLVLEMLVNGTPPSAVSSNIASQVALTTPGVIIHSLPGDSYIRRCRTILRIIGETLTAYRLGKH